VHSPIDGRQVQAHSGVPAQFMSQVENHQFDDCDEGGSAIAEEVASLEEGLGGERDHEDEWGVGVSSGVTGGEAPKNGHDKEDDCGVAQVNHVKGGSSLKVSSVKVSQPATLPVTHEEGQSGTVSGTFSNDKVVNVKKTKSAGNKIKDASNKDASVKPGVVGGVQGNLSVSKSSASSQPPPHYSSPQLPQQTQELAKEDLSSVHASPSPHSPPSALCYLKTNTCNENQ